MTSRWDVIVVGTGMGGATLGYALARAGLGVLFLEKGRGDKLADTSDGDRPAADPSAEMLRGRFAESFFNLNDSNGTTDERVQTLRAAGRRCQLRRHSSLSVTPRKGNDLPVP